MKLLRTLILRPLGRDPLRTALTILSVALGVAVIVAIDLAGDAATGSFSSSMQSLAGRNDFEILANGGIDERYMGVLSALPFDVHFSPVMEAQETIAGIGSVPLYGVDLAGSPEQRPASRALAVRLHWPAAQTIDAPGEFLLMDIADFQQRFHRYGKLDRIDVTVGREEDSHASSKRFAPRCRPLSSGKARRTERRKSAHAARVPLESAGA